jgi:uncharacterized protein YndB with AHSA1/START domain
MKSIVAIEINRPRREVAMLLADPANMTKWMHDLERYDHVGGEQGAVGARYRMVPKPGERQGAFISTVTAMHLPERLSVRLQSSKVDVLVDTTFTAVARDRTRLVSAETFIFHGFFRKLLGLFARRDIRRHHRAHIESFKRFAETAP